MDREKKRSRWALWATVVVVVALIGYPLSFGPACWIASRSERTHIPTFYWPIQTYVPCCPGGATAVAWYAKLFLPTESFGVLVPFHDRDGKLARVRYHADPPTGIDPGQL